MKSGEPFALAALWENWRDPAIGDNIRFTVLTCEPNSPMATFHNRVPVILEPEDYMIWQTAPKRTSHGTERLPISAPKAAACGGGRGAGYRSFR